MPSSYQAPMRRDAQLKPGAKRTVSQSSGSNLVKDTATVSNLLDGKGRKVFSIRPTDTLNEAVRELRDKKIGALVVTEEDGSLAGILSERDIVRKLAETPGQTLPQSVADNMTSKVVTCSPDDALIEVLRRMTDGRFRHMPVLDGDTLIGVLTIGDVVNYRLREMEHETLQLKQMIVG